VNNLISKFKEVVEGIFRGKSIEYIGYEEREFENIFALLVLGSFIGLPSPPTTVSLRLLPHMGRELVIMASVSRRLDDMLGEMAGLFEIT